jgi:uncharacterized spore protein YtfJ
MAVAGKTSDADKIASAPESEGASAGFARAMEQVATHVVSHANASSVFGAPVSSDGVTFVPVARVLCGYGAGAGAGAASEPDDAGGKGGGIGGGGGFIVSPVGAFEIGRDGIRYRRAEGATSLRTDLTDLLSVLVRRLLHRGS